MPDAGGEIRSKAAQVVAQAEAALTAWRRLPPRARAGPVRRLRRAILVRQERIADAIARDTGKPLTEALNQEVTAALEMLRFIERSYPRWLRPRRFRYWRPGFWAKTNAIHFDPIGVVAVIGPGNYPFSLAVMQAAAAAVCGNGVIVKPSERCPQTMAVLREIIEAAAFPSGVVGMVQGGAETAQALIENPAVRKVFFTGSYEAGRAVAEACGRHFKPCVLELGGSGAAIVWADADLDLAARGIAWSAFYANGSSCVATRRVFVHATVYDAFVERVRDEARRLRPGDPLDPATDVGYRVLETGVRFRASGAGGSDAGFLTPDARNLTRDFEPAGAIVAVRRVESIDQAVAEANACEFGLGASVWTRRRRTAEALAGRLEVGLVWINDTSIGLPPFPWGGVKRSGWGRLFARECLAEMTATKVVAYQRRFSSRPQAWWFPYSAEKRDLFVALNRVAYGRVRLRAVARFVAAWWRARGPR